ncbi:MAG: peptide/nickel transport system substrate-binding protein, partial [Paracoccaceae bacterium]
MNMFLQHTASAVLATALMLAATTGAQAETFRWSSTTDPQTMDPHAVNSAAVLGFLNNI